VTGLSSDLRNLLSTSEPPQLGPERRPGTLSIGEIDAQLSKLARSGPKALLVRATLYLWHDHLDEAHSIAQGIETSDGSYLHGIMHRREPDYSNARYWLNRVGKHRCFTALAKRTREILDSKSTPEMMALIKPAQWDPYAFIEACERVAESQNAAEKQQLRQIQGAELEVLLEHFASQ